MKISIDLKPEQVSQLLVAGEVFESVQRAMANLRHTTPEERETYLDRADGIKAVMMNIRVQTGLLG